MAQGVTVAAGVSAVDLTTPPAIGGTTPNTGNFTSVTASVVSGSVWFAAVPVTVTAGTYSVALDSYISCNFAGIVTLTLPAAGASTGRRIVIKTITANTVVSASSNVTPQAGGAAGTAILAATAGKFAELISDGTSWVIFGAN